MAMLLAAMATSEEIQARRILMYLRGKLGNADAFISDLESAKQETCRNDYPRLSRSLEAEGEKKAAEAIDQFAQVAGNHADLMSRMRQTEAAEPNDLYVCQICGYIAEREPPEKCPVCNAIREKFVPASLVP